MKLLLDEMHAPAVAGELRARGHDAVAVKERSDLVGLADEELLGAAAAEGRALVTETSRTSPRWTEAGLEPVDAMQGWCSPIPVDSRAPGGATFDDWPMP